MSISAPNLSQFQRQFGDYLRQQQADDSVPARVGSLYQQLIWNNLTGFINQCFIICRQIVEPKAWQALQHAFLKQGQLHSPYFNEISWQFVQFVQDNPSLLDELGLPPYLSELVHYEWVELYVDNLPDVPTTKLIGDVGMNPTVQVLHYQWQVEKIGTQYQPDEPEESFILVYRKRDDDKYSTAFMQINALTYVLMSFIKQSHDDGVCYADIDELFALLADAYQVPTDELRQFADGLFKTMLEHQVLVVSP